MARDRRADRDVQRLAAFVQQLTRQQRGAQSRMHQARHVKSQAVGAMEVNRDHCRSGETDHARDGIIPGWVGDLEVRKLKRRNFARREHHQQSAGSKPVNRVAHWFGVRFRGVLAAERVDRDQMLAHIAHFGEQGFARMRTSFRMRVSSEKITGASASPKGWLHTSTTGPVAGMRRRSSPEHS